MAILSTKATKVALAFNKISAAPTATAMAALSSTDDAAIYVASTGTYGILLPFEEAKNRRILVKIENTDTAAGKAVYVAKGTNTVVAPNANLQLTTTTTLAASGTVYVCLETGKYGQLSGAYKGNIVLLGADAKVKVSYFVLP